MDEAARRRRHCLAGQQHRDCLAGQHAVRPGHGDAGARSRQSGFPLAGGDPLPRAPSRRYRARQAPPAPPVHDGAVSSAAGAAGAARALCANPRCGRGLEHCPAHAPTCGSRLFDRLRGDRHGGAGGTRRGGARGGGPLRGARLRDADGSHGRRVDGEGAVARRQDHRRCQEGQRRLQLPRAPGGAAATRLGAGGGLPSRAHDAAANPAHDAGLLPGQRGAARKPR
mmetsp:Transcript_6265/g.14468  ORF Transcript_6265/g.14468 Transcript_6265/m.14468 type:complete len:226 (+) Transcript_6265:419-1096(+)